MKPFLKKSLIGIVVGISILALAFLFLLRQFSKPYDPKDIVPPERAAGIPADHEWIGGPDGGTWIHCKPEKEYKEFRCSVYGESGELYAKGLYLPSRPVVPPYELMHGGMGRIILKDQQQGLMVEIKAEGWIEYADGTSLYKDGEPVDGP
ncbi:MAG TPA: hypothetical protein VFO10_23455 [Oligoflexus sp.]|uniref:hypothetical protein n=1 Tax=Oligoflexus sp. TaxID=1971216 RepID=UPI002D7F1E64|nr:hypothetical protein [Oligoflexus sp.]HET9240240.1 hypothetical protein [Oligoflexus sp.]